MDVFSAMLWRKAIKPARKALKKKFGGFDDEEKDSLLDGFGGVSSIVGGTTLRCGIRLSTTDTLGGVFLFAEGQFVDASAFSEWFATIGTHHQPRGHIGAWTVAENDTTLAGCRSAPNGAVVAFCQKNPAAEAYYRGEISMLQLEVMPLFLQILYPDATLPPTKNLILAMTDVSAYTPWQTTFPFLANVEQLTFDATLELNACYLNLVCSPCEGITLETLAAEVVHYKETLLQRLTLPKAAALLSTLQVVCEEHTLRLSVTLTPTLWTELWDELKGYIL